MAATWARFLALSLDLILPLSLGTLAAWGVFHLDPEPPSIAPWNIFDQAVDYLRIRPAQALSILTIYLGLIWLWQPLFGPQSPGQLPFKIRLINAQGTPASRSRLALWSLLRILLLSLAGLGLWWALIDPEKRSLHDRLSGIWAEIKR